jgi:hypothetical protein
MPPDCFLRRQSCPQWYWSTEHLADRPSRLFASPDDGCGVPVEQCVTVNVQELPASASTWSASAPNVARLVQRRACESSACMPTRPNAVLERTAGELVVLRREARDDRPQAFACKAAYYDYKGIESVVLGPFGVDVRERAWRKRSRRTSGGECILVLVMTTARTNSSRRSARRSISS